MFTNKVGESQRIDKHSSSKKKLENVSIAEPLLLNPQHEQYTTLHGTHPLLTGKNGKQLKRVRKRKGLTGKEGMGERNNIREKNIVFRNSIEKIDFSSFLVCL